MFRWAILALVVACPAATAQSSEEDARRLSAALTQADVDTLGACQARVEGMGRTVEEFQNWLQQEGHMDALAGIRDARDKGADLITRFQELRTLLGSRAGGFNLATSDAARTTMAAAFQRRAGENEYDAYNRWRRETNLPPECGAAMKRARWRVELEELAWKQ